MALKLGHVASKAVLLGLGIGASAVLGLRYAASRVDLLRMFMEFLELTPNLVGSWTMLFEGKSYTVGDGCPAYRPIVTRVKDERFFAHVVTYRNLGLAEAYMDGWFEFVPGTPEKPNGGIYDLFTFILINRIDKTLDERRPSISLVLRALITYLVCRVRGHTRNIDVHFGINREMFLDMLGSTEAYTCGYLTSENSALPDDYRQTLKLPVVLFDPEQPEANIKAVMEGRLFSKPPAVGQILPPPEYAVHPFDLNIDLRLDIDGIQRAKFDRICRKLRLQPGMRLLDIGCGYGGFAIYAARTYGVEVVAFANAIQMIEGANAAAHAAGLRDTQYKFYCADMSILRTLPDGAFDAISAIGVFEHVHEYEYRMVFDRLRALLNPNGLLLLHMLCSVQKPNIKDPFLQTYIFPNSHMNLLSDLCHELEIRDMLVLDIEDIGHHYAFTLDCWWRNLKAHFDKHPGRYTPAYMRMMEYYLLSLKAVASHGSGGVKQILASKNSRNFVMRALHRI